MKVPVDWLTQYCDPGLGVEELASALALSGTEVERVTTFGVPRGDGNGALFRIGEVKDVSQHPEADRLKVCRVRLADADERTIVCGAPNVAAGQAVLVALPGAVLPDGTRLGKVKLRGVESDGMILSETEVQLGSDSEGIMVLPDSFEVGEEAQAYLPIGDDVMELEVTPNRPDTLAVYGVAREVHAVTGAPLAPDPGEQDVEPDSAGGGAAQPDSAGGNLISVEIEDLDLCSRFSVRLFTDVQVGPSPLWLKARLMSAGQRPISNVVDITNYVMLLLGQPMHAYDLDRVAGPELSVRCAREGERLTTLDGEVRVFDSDAVLVCDASGPIGIGGIMGGASSEVSEGTTRVAMEAATWNGPNILQTSKKLGLRTEASTRFEKQLHPRLALHAQRLAARLMVELCGARLVVETIDVAAPEPKPRRVTLRTARLEGLLGERIEADESRTILERLGFGVQREGEDLDVKTPYYRHYDVQREADVIEEVARIHGLERLPATLPARERAVGRLSRDQQLRRTIEDLLRGRGLSEVVTWSFTSPETVRRLRLPPDDPRARVLAIANPLSEDQSVMRTSLLPGLLDAARHNVARDIPDLRLFETGRVFFSRGQDELPDERLHLAVVLTGAFVPRGWRSEPRLADFYVVKGLLAGLLDMFGVRWRLIDGGPPFLHPGRAAEVVVDAREAGCLGELHPAVAADFGLGDLERPPAMLELDLDVVLPVAARVGRRYEDLIGYPAVYQDIAVVVDEPVEAQTVVDSVRAAGGPDLRNVHVFDLYRGEQVGEGRKSLALRLEFRSTERTLTDEEVAQVRERIKREIERETGGSLRE
jgi:phenylalanyl-tRNA synthetase beta chain